MAHTNPSYRDREAVAPYNFVPLPTKPFTVTSTLPLNRYTFTDKSDRRVYTGSFECELTTETPFFIRGLLTSADYQTGKESKNNPAFFSLDGGKTPCIPGSSLRGLFRTLIEIVTNSRLSAVTDQKAVYRAVDTTRLGIQYRNRVQEEVRERWFVPYISAGYIRKVGTEWYIQPARTINGTTWCRISHRALQSIQDRTPWPPEEIRRTCDTKTERAGRNAQTIYIEPGSFEFQEVRGDFLHIKFARALRASATPDAGLQVAALIESGRMDSKRSEAVIFAPDTTKTREDGWLPLRFPDPNDADHTVELDRDYRDQVSPQQASILGRPQGALQDMQPVFYLIEKDRLTFFGHTMMMRLPYRYSPLDLVPEALRSNLKDDIDMAEDLFGFVRRDAKGKNKACAGRVFFSDGQYTANLAQPFEPEITPKVLSGPKTTTFQHYLEQTSPNDKEQLLNYDDVKSTRIRGRKLYWHKGAVTIQDVEERDANKLKHASQYTRIRPLKPGAVFRFKIRFENLKAEELGALAWLLRCANAPDYRLKLGMGKPHGMGSIKISSTLHLNDRLARYQSLFAGSAMWASGDTSEADAAQTLNQVISEFEDGVAGSAELFMSQPHIRELLTMLQWPGPDPKRTRYMEIERRDLDGRKINEYRNRPVLPTPNFVVQPKYLGDRAPQLPKKRDEEPPARPHVEQPQYVRPVEPIPLPEVREQVSAEAEALAKKLAHQKAIAEGDVLVATVVRVTGNDYECSLGDGIKTLGRLPRDEQKGLKAGDQLRVKVKRIAGSGAAILTVRGVPKG